MPAATCRNIAQVIAPPIRAAGGSLLRLTHRGILLFGVLAGTPALAASPLAPRPSPLAAAPPTSPSPLTLKYEGVQAPLVLLQHVRIIDGTGGAPLEDRNLLISDGRIAAVTDGADSAGQY